MGTTTETPRPSFEETMAAARTLRQRGWRHYATVMGDTTEGGRYGMAFDKVDADGSHRTSWLNRETIRALPE